MHNTTINAVTQHLGAAITEHHLTHVQPQIDALNSHNTTQDNRLRTLENNIAAIQLQQQQTNTTLNEATANVEVLARPPTSRIDRDADLYQRKPDLSILIANTDRGSDITKKDFVAGITPWLSEAGIASDSLEVQGPELGSKFVITLQCAGNLAARRLRTAFGLLKDKDKNWRKLEAPSPSNPQTMVQIFINYDEAPRDRRQNGAARAVARLLRLELPTQKVFCRSNIVQVGRDELARLTAATAEVPIKLQFYPKAVEKYSVDSEKIREAFEQNSTHAVSESEWV